MLHHVEVSPVARGKRVETESLVEADGDGVGLPPKRGQPKGWFSGSRFGLQAARGAVADGAVEPAGVMNPGDAFDGLEASLVVVGGPPHHFR
jgi:hypothetical protein